MKRQKGGVKQNKTASSTTANNITKGHIHKLEKIASQLSDFSIHVTPTPTHESSATKFGKEIDIIVDEFLGNNNGDIFEQEDDKMNDSVHHSKETHQHIEEDDSIDADISTILLVPPLNYTAEEKDAKQKEFDNYYKDLNIKANDKRLLIEEFSQRKIYIGAEYSMLDFIVMYSRKIRACSLFVGAIDNDLMFLYKMLPSKLQPCTPKSSYDFKKLV